MTLATPGKVLLGAQDVKKHFGAQVVLDGISITIHEDDRIGLIGRNGSGKSTLLRILSGALVPDSGFTTRGQGVRVALLEQHSTLCPEQTIAAALATATAPSRALVAEWRALTERMAHTPGDCWEHQEIQRACADLQLRIDAAGAWNLDVETRHMAEVLRLPPLDTALATLSGGELRRVDLAAKLLAHPDVLLLDEPTNHIDAESINWIERFLESYSGACVLVTHDRYFLDRITNRIIEINYGTTINFPGNYGRFLEYKAAVQDVQIRTEANRRALIKRELAWYKRSPKARGTKAKARIGRLNVAREQGPPPPNKQFAFAIPEPERLGKDILEARQITHGYRGRTLFKQFSLYMQKGQRIGIVGPNGCGKSTLLRVLMGREAPESGDVLIGRATRFLYVDQTLSDMAPEQRVLDFVSDGQRHVEIGKQRIHVPSYLETFLFDKSCVEMPVGRLSGGERRRVDLAKKLLRGGNFLVMDEPTNDLDLYTLRVLEETIECFSGCALIVSHDRYLLNRLCTHMLAFEEDGAVVQITGNYTDYLLYCERRRLESRAEQQARPRAKAEPKAAPGPARGLTYLEKRELAEIEEKIRDAEAIVAGIETQLQAPDFYEQNHELTRPVLDAYEAAKREVERLYARWQHLEEKQRPNGNR